MKRFLGALASFLFLAAGASAADQPRSEGKAVVKRAAPAQPAQPEFKLGLPASRIGMTQPSERPMPLSKPNGKNILLRGPDEDLSRDTCFPRWVCICWPTCDQIPY